MRVEFAVFGTPIPQGSMSAFVPKGWSRAIITSANPKLKQWRAAVNVTAQSAMRLQCQDRAERGTPLNVVLYFYFRRPKSVKPGAAKTSKPDIDKLARAIFDSLTGVVYEDDSQVIIVTASKDYEEQERVEIFAESL